MRKLRKRIVNPYANKKRELQYPLEHGKIIVQKRQSRSMQIGNVATEVYEEDMVPFARNLCVDPDNQVIVIDENMGENGSLVNVSGRTPTEKRKGMLYAYTLIRELYHSGEDRVVLFFCHMEDRLFRDNTGKYYNEFIDILKTYDVLLRTYNGYTYDFNNNMDVKIFRMKCDFASDDLDIRNEKLNGAKQHMMEKGQFAANGCLPAGFMRNPTKDKEDKYYMKPIEYTPWARVVRDLYKRYYELGSVLSVYREIEGIPIFPPLHPSEKKYHAFRRPEQRKEKEKEEEGFCLSYPGLHYILRNPMYAGYWFNTITGKWIPDNHPAIVPAEHFWFAFNRLSPERLDGQPNSQRIGHSAPRNPTDEEKKEGALFHGLFCHNSPTIKFYTMLCTEENAYYYGMYDTGKPLNAERLRIKAHVFDDPFLPFIATKLKETSALEAYKKAYEEYKAQKEKTNNDLQPLIDIYHAKLLEIEARIDTLTNPKLLKKEEKKYEETLSRIEELKNQMQINPESLNDRRQKLIEYYDLVCQKGKHFSEVNRADKRKIIEGTIDSIFIEIISSSFLLVRIKWFAWDIQTFLFRRTMTRSSVWTEEEKTYLQQHFITDSIEKILMSLPSRSWRAIRAYAGRHYNLHRSDNYHLKDRIPLWAKYDLSYDDLQIAQQYGYTPERGNVMLINNSKFLQTAPTI